MTKSITHGIHHELQHVLVHNRSELDDVTMNVDVLLFGLDQRKGLGLYRLHEHLASLIAADYTSCRIGSKPMSPRVSAS